MKALFTLLLLALLGCQTTTTTSNQESIPAKKALDFKVTEAQGFQIEVTKSYAIIKVNKPWPGSENTYNYLIKYDTITKNPNQKFDAIVQHPIQKHVLSSTTHIPSVERLGELKSWIGFPNTDYISSPNARDLIDQGLITDIGQNQQLNTELVLNLNPDVFVGFTVKGANKAYKLFEKSNIPVIYNGDWVESTPLGKAEWIKFFGALFNKNKEAQTAYNRIKKSYLATKKIAATAKNKPSVISGSLYQDKWYLPNGQSWQAQFLQDANANYLYSHTTGNGSIALSFESVLNKAAKAKYWISPGSYTSYKRMLEDQPHYAEFTAFKHQKVYSVADKTGETGGVIFYELAPNRPDLVLKDLVKIFHPFMMQDHKLHFFSPLKP